MNQNDNFIPDQENYKILTPFKLFVKSNFPFIEATYEALDNYGLYCEIVKYLNTVIENENTVEDNVQALYNAFVSLNNYVADYFENLDVQNEINVKLDNMVKDGSLKEIIDEAFNDYYEKTMIDVDDKLTSKVDKDGIGQINYNNLSQGVKEAITGGSVAVVGYNSVTDTNVVDNSISYSKLNNNGKKGTASKNVLQSLNLEYEQGTRHVDGTVTSASNTVVCKAPFKIVKGMHIITKAGYVSYIYSWSSGSLVRIGSNSFSNQYVMVGSTTNYIDNDYDFYISVRKSDSSALTPQGAENAIEIIKPQNIEKIDYSSLAIDLSKFMNQKETNLKYEDVGIYGNAISESFQDFQYYNIVSTDIENQSSIYRVWFQHPVFLPYGTKIKCDSDYKFILIKSSSRYEYHKEYIPNFWTDDFIVTEDNDYYINYKMADDSGVYGTIDDFLEGLEISIPAPKPNNICYVSGTGNDTTGDGTKSHPFREINTAIEKGFKTIICKNNYKYNNIELENANDIKIIGEQENYSQAGLRKAYFDNSEYLSLGTLENEKIKIAYTPDENSFFYDCLISQEKPLTDTSSGRSNGYYVTIYSDGNNLTSKRYIPVLSIDDNVTGTFFYDDGYIYINPYTENDNSTQFLLIDSSAETKENLVILTECNNISFENFKFKHSSQSLFQAVKCSNIKIINCDFAGSSLNNNVDVRNSNITIENCYSYLARNDGYNFHGNGKSIVTNCIGNNNFDDGISHHENCDSIIIGGEYFGNHKGGVSSPTYSAYSEITGVYSHDNQYGIYAVSNESYANCKINGNNNLLTGNSVGIYCVRCDGIIYNNKILNNSNNVSISNSNVVNYN